MDETVLLERKEVLNEIISKINPEDPRIIAALAMLCTFRQGFALLLHKNR